MTWQIDFLRSAEKDLDKLDKQVAIRILRFLHERISPLDDPRLVGQALRGSELGNLWRYRVGDYRIIADIQDNAICILVVSVGHRCDVYR